MKIYFFIIISLFLLLYFTAFCCLSTGKKRKLINFFPMTDYSLRNYYSRPLVRSRPISGFGADQHHISPLKQYWFYRWLWVLIGENKWQNRSWYSCDAPASPSTQEGKFISNQSDSTYYFFKRRVRIYILPKIPIKSLRKEQLGLLGC